MQPADLRIVFMGTPEFAVPALKALHASGYQIVGVYTQPPRPAGRGQKLTPCPVQVFAEENNLPFFHPTSLKQPEQQAAFANLKPDLAVVAAYGLLLPQAILDIPTHGCLNIHGSLLPRWRGAAPIHHAIMAGDTQTGITLMKMEAGLDTGPYYVMRSTAITETTTYAEMHDTLSQMGADLLIDSLPDIINGKLPAITQDDSLANYAKKITKEQGKIDWSKPAAQIHREIRALASWPGMVFTIGEENIKILQATLVNDLPHAFPGEVVDDRFTIACGNGFLRPDILQRPGKGPVATADFLRGFPITKGTRLAQV